MFAIYATIVKYIEYEMFVYIQSTKGWLYFYVLYVLGMYVYPPYLYMLIYW